jgi:nitrogen fixation/metabolism regulation signal transduction histidine kinase
MQEMRIENEQKTHYLNTIVNNLSIGILAFGDSEKVELLNPAACRILNCEKFYFLSKLKKSHFEIYHAIKKATRISQHLIKINTENGLLNLAFRSNLIKIGKRNIHIVSFQNINRELDHIELDSWQKLIRVLNHEIINSITPITTLSKTIQRYIHFDNKLKKVSDLNDEIVNDIAINAEIITERGKGLIDFIEVYKNITKSPKLNVSKIKVVQIIQKVQKFYQQKFNEEQIKFESKVSADLELNADEALIEQMLINLTKNSIEAVVDKIDPHIRMEAYKSGTGSIIIKIVDNGEGIPESEQDKIFIPFYSTKQNGSGIGLSLSKQIMHMHNGSISVSSHPGIETSFILRF